MKISIDLSVETYNARNNEPDFEELGIAPEEVLRALRRRLGYLDFYLSDFEVWGLITSIEERKC